MDIRYMIPLGYGEIMAVGVAGQIVILEAVIPER